MDSPSAVGRRRGNSRVNAEDQALDQIAKEIDGHIMFCHLAHKLPWNCLAESLTEFKGCVQFPIGKCGRIHCNNSGTRRKLQHRHKYIHDNSVCYDDDCETIGFETFSKNEKQSKTIDTKKHPLKQFQRKKVEYFCRRFAAVIDEFANTATQNKEDISNAYLETCDLREFVDTTIPCTECYGSCRREQICKNYVVFCLFVSGRMDILERLHELGRIDIKEALWQNYGGQAVGNGYIFLIEGHILPFYLLSNIIIQCGFENEPSKWAGLNPEKPYSLYRNLEYDCDFKTFLPNLRHLLSVDIFMKDAKATQELLKGAFRSIYQYVYLKRKYQLQEDPIPTEYIYGYVVRYLGLANKERMI